MGIERGKRESLLRQMRRKFGNLSDEVVKRVEAVTDSDELDRLFDRVVDSSSLEELDLTGA